MNILEISNLSVRYETQEIEAISDISFVLKKGEILLITGPTGSGKSTLINAINGIIPNVIPAEVSGSIKYESESINNLNIMKRALKIGTVFQNPETQLFALTVEEDVAFGPENLMIDKKELRKRVDESLNVMDLFELKNSFVFHLSGGQKQRLAMTGIFAMKPEILIFDEPTSDLDPQGTQEIIKYIKHLAHVENKSILIIEHKLHDIISLIDRILLLDKGKVIVDNTPEKAFRDNLEDFQRLGINIPEKFNPFPQNSSNKAYKILNDEDILTIKEYNFKFNDKLILQDLNLVIKKGEFIALLGRNGSGKTTLFKNIIGILKSDIGSINFNGSSIKKKKIHELAKNIGFLFQNPSHQIFLNDVRDELLFGLKNKKISEEEKEHRLKKIVNLLELEDLINRKTHTLSRGQSQRVALASILMLEPQLLLLDEPTTGQDYRNRKEIMNLAKKLNDRGITILFITHDIDLAAIYAHRIIILDKGRIIKDGTPDEVFNDAELLKEIGFRYPKLMGAIKN